jgi:hypothetical protein
MNFKPKSREEIESMGLMKAGLYPFQVSTAKDKTSKNGNEMIELNLEVFDNEGRAFHIFDYLLEAIPQKLFGFCSTVGLEPQYHSGILSSNDCIGRTGYVEIDIQKGAPNPTGGNYPDKNSVKKYLTKPSANNLKNNTQDFDDDILF